MKKVENFCVNEEAFATLKNVPTHILAVSVINLNNLVHNYHKVEEQIDRDVKIGAVVKADAYGCGAIHVGKRLYKEGCRHFFVATIEEGIQLRAFIPNDGNIYVLGGPLLGTEELFVEHSIIPVLTSKYHANLWINYCKKLSTPLSCVIHVDTGMTRNGFSEEEIIASHENLKKFTKIELIMSHLACADEKDNPLNALQLARFNHLSAYFPETKRSLAATNGVLLGKDYAFDIVRTGKFLYGFSVCEDKVEDLAPVVEVFAKIVQINKLKKGGTVGYGATYIAQKDMVTITAGIGYADGFMRKFSGFGYGFLKNFKLPIIGRISMDYIVLDATDVDKNLLNIGDWIALTRTPDYTLSKWALELNTLPHEVSCKFGNRVKRIYIGDDE